MVVLHILAGKFYRDGPPAAIGIRLRIVAECIEVSQIVPDRSECVLFVLPVFRKIGFAAGCLAYPLKYSSRDGFLLRLTCADHVDDGSSRLSQLCDVSGGTRLALSGPFEKTTIAFRPINGAASLTVSKRLL